MENVSTFTAIAQAFQNGGIWMIAILLVQITSIAIIAERVYALFMKSSRSQKDLIQSFESDIKNGRMDDVISKAKSIVHSEPVASVVLAGALVAKDLGSRDEIQAKMDEVLTHENMKLERRTGFLSMLANVSTLLGLLGTIIGLIQSFAAVSSMNATEKSVLLTKGVALAMDSTAYGLITAIPALIAFAILMNRTQQLQEDLNQASFKVLNWMSFNYQAMPVKASRKA